MDKIDILGHTIYKYESPIELYTKQKLKDGIDKLFNSDLVKNFGNFSLEQRGKAYSTCPLNNMSLVVNIEEMMPLIQWITDMVLDRMGKSINDSVGYRRIWINKMFMGCSGACHVHDYPNIDGVAIFYLNVPKNDSGELIILKHIVDEELSKKHKSICKTINVKSGDLIIHSKDTPHAVSEHKNEEPRICLVLEFFML